MAIHYRTQGIILQKRDQGESDRVFMVYSKDFGKLELWAISERKITSKLRGGLELFCLSELEFIQGKNKKVVIDAIPLARFSSIRRDLERLEIAYRIGEVVDLLVRGQEPDTKIWKILHDTFETLEHYERRVLNGQFIYFIFLRNLLCALGYNPLPEHCPRCQNEFRDTLELFASQKPKDLFETSLNPERGALLVEISHHYLSQFL